MSAVIFATATLSAQTPLRIVQGVDANQLRVLANHHPSWANPANDAGILPQDQLLDAMTMVLQRSPEQEAAFQKLLAEQLDPTSPNYHHWLTPAEVGGRFGLADQDIDTLSAWLQSQGLHVNWISPSRTFIGFGGTAAQMGLAFHTEFHAYKVKDEERIAPASDPMIPVALQPAIKAIAGFYTVEDYSFARAIAQPMDAPDITASSGNHYLSPADFKLIYDLPANPTGSGESIGIVGRSRTNFADFDNFRTLTETGFADPTEIIPTAYGGVDPGPAQTSCTTSPCNASGDQGEATLDVLRAGSIAPFANILLVVATQTSGGIRADAQYLVQTSPVPVQVISISFGSCESSAGSSNVNFWDTLFQQAAGEGISVFISSGDSGASGCDTHGTLPPASPAPNSPNYICSSSYATCVGGTEFNDASDPSTYWSSTNGSNLSSALGYIPEGAWNEPLSSSSATQVAASGGGVSAYIATPSWQTGTGVPTARAGRYTPDIAFSSSGHDGYFGCLAAAGGSCVVTNGSFHFLSFSGTSAAAPSMAGIAALLNQSQGTPQGNLNPKLYELAASAPAAFHDVTVASSGVSNCDVNTPSMCNNSIASPTGLTGGQAGYLVTDGYDEVTGLGSLDAAVFIANYASGKATPSVTVSGSGFSVTPGATSGNTAKITITPVNGFTGSVALSAAITSSPTGAEYLPTLSFGTTSSVNITGTTAQTATLTVTTTAASSNAVSSPAHSGISRYGTGAALACLLLFCLPSRRRSWQTLLKMTAMLVILSGGMMACGSSNSGGGGGGNSGTTAGSYTITITCTSGGSTLTTGTLTLVVE
ncbi:MAG: S53 family peptidase [Terracidiphilus sp.]